MEKFIIGLVKGDIRTMLALFDTKEEALAAGPFFRKKHTREQGLISCISANIDKQGQIDYSRYKLYETWD